MLIILNSFLLSFKVMARMALPMLGVFVISIAFWAFVSIVTMGLSQYVSGPITTAFLTLLGIRAALSLKGDQQGIDFKMLATYSLVYGLILGITKTVLVVLASLIAIFVTEWNLGDLGSLWSLENAEKGVQALFALHVFSLNAVLSLVFLVALPTALAVPMAAAAQSVSKGAPSRGLFEGFGSSFVPLFVIFFISYFFMFFFETFGVLFLFLPLLLANAISALVTFEFSAIPVDMVAKGLLACLVLLWLHAWIWAASALAFRKFEHKAVPEKKAVSADPMPDPEPETQDMRALRKSRVASQM